MIFLILIVWILFSFSFGSLRNQTLVLRKFVLNPNSPNDIVTIVARRSGLFSWLLTLIWKISPEVSLTATTKDIRFCYKSISKEENILITLKDGVSHIYCKYHKPLWLLVLSIVILFVGITGNAIMRGYYYTELTYVLYPSIFIAIIFFLMYLFKKSIAIVVETNGGSKYGIKFKPSEIEGEDVNLARARAVVDVIQNQIIINKG